MTRWLLTAVCVALAACGAPALTLEFEQHYAIDNEDRALRHAEMWRTMDEPAIGCIPGSMFQVGEGQLPYVPDCDMPWYGRFDVPWLDSNPQSYFIQGQLSRQTIEADDSASLLALCSDAVEHVRLTAAERTAIGAAAEASGFFDFPADLAQLSPVLHADGMETIVLFRDACNTSELDLAFGGRHNRVHWDCSTAWRLGQEDAAAPEQIRPLLAALEKAFRTHAPIKALLPFAQCPTLLEKFDERRCAAGVRASCAEKDPRCPHRNEAPGPLLYPFLYAQNPFSLVCQ